MLNILKLPLLCIIFIVLQGCASIEYYEFLEPQRSANEQFIGTPYVYSGLVEIGEQSQNYQFSGVLYDDDDKILDVTIPTHLAINSDPKNLVELRNSDHERKLGEPALLVVNPNYPFNIEEVKSQPHAFAQKYYLQYQPLLLSQVAVEPSTCPHILLLNIDVYEELPTTLEIGRCFNTGIEASSYVWQIVSADHILNNVEHDKMFGHQLGYLGFLLTVPFDMIASPIYTLGWGLVASKNLLFSVDEEEVK
jgi:hypothetical protein